MKSLWMMLSRKDALFCRSYLLDYLRGKAFVIDEDYALLIQSERKLVLGSEDILSARDGKRSRKGIDIHRRTGIGYLGKIDIPLYAHIKLPVGIHPLFGADHGNILEIDILECSRIKLFDPLAYLVIHSYPLLPTFSDRKYTFCSSEMR